MIKVPIKKLTGSDKGSFENEKNVIDNTALTKTLYNDSLLLTGEERANKVFFNTICSLAVTSLILSIIFYYLKFVPNPLDSAYIHAHMTIIYGYSPEAPERDRYMALTVLFPVLFALFYWIFNKLKINIKIAKASTILYPAILIFVIFFFYRINMSVNYLYLYSLLYHNTLLTVILSVFFSILIIAYQKCHRNVIKATDVLLLAVCIAVTVYMASLYITTSYWTVLFNFDAYYYPVYEVFYGKTLVVDFNNIYGFYPYILVPILKIFGKITIFKFSLIISSVMFVSLTALLFTIWLNIKNKVIATLSFFSVVFFVVELPLLITPGFYLAYQPHRVLFPSLILLVCSIWMRIKTKKLKSVVTIIGFILTCISMIWNIETGLVVLIAWCLFLLYNVALEYSLNEAIFYIKSVSIILFTAMSAFFSYAIINLITYIRTGVLLSFTECFFGPTVFYKLGYLMLPMPSFHPWLILVFLYVVGLILSLRNIKFLNKIGIKYSRNRSAMYFVISVLGLGVFSYYQGRSHDAVFTAVVWPGVVILALFFQSFFERITFSSNIQDKSSFFKSVFYYADIAKFALITVFFVSFAMAFPYYLRYDGLLSDLRNRVNYYDSNPVSNNLAILKNVTENNKNVDFLIQEGDYYYTKLGLKNNTNLASSVDWYTIKDINKVNEYLNHTQDQVVMDDYINDVLLDHDKVQYEKIINNRFIKRALGGGYYLYTLKEQSK